MKDDFDTWEQQNNKLFKEKEELKNKNKKMNKDLEYMENEIIRENIELKELNIFQFCTKNKLASENHDKNKFFKNFDFKELKEINDNY